MKRVLALLLALMMMFSLAACGGGNNNGNDDNQIENEQQVGDENKDDADADNNENNEQVNDSDKDNPADNDGSSSGNNGNNSGSGSGSNSGSNSQQKPSKPETPEAGGGNDAQDATVGQVLLADFQNVVKDKQDALSIADAIIANKIIPFAGATMTMEAGSYLAGFGDVTITGYKDCAMFGPVIGTIPFIGYIFELEDGTDSAEFTKTLKDNANLRWNICTAAEETTVATSGNFVFFLMSPAQFESAQ